MLKKKKLGYIEVVKETYPSELPKDKLSEIVSQIQCCTRSKPVPMNLLKIIEGAIMVRVDRLETKAEELYHEDEGKKYAQMINKITSENYRLEGVRKELKRTKACQKLNI